MRKLNLITGLFVFLFFASLTTVRFFGIFAILGARGSVEIIDSALPNAKYPLHLLKTKKAWEYAICSIILPLIFFGQPKLGLHYVPLAEIDFIKKNYSGKKFFNLYGDGGSIIYYGDGKFQHFIDGRAGTVFAEKIMKDYVDYIKFEPNNWSNVFDQYDFDGAMIPRNHLNDVKINNFFADWNLVLKGPKLNIYVKRANFKLQKDGKWEIQLLEKDKKSTDERK